MEKNYDASFALRLIKHITVLEAAGLLDAQSASHNHTEGSTAPSFQLASIDVLQ